MIDRFGRRHVYLRLAVTDRCNLRCTYCMPPAGVPWKERAAVLTFEEIERVVRVLTAMGICKVRLTGGEPTVRPGLPGLAARLAAIPGVETLALTTNGVSLEDLARPFRDAGVSKLNVSLDTLRRDRFTRITGRDRLREVLRGIEAALSAGFSPIKLNVVVMGGINDDELCDFVEFSRHRPLNVRFIELMPFKGNGWNPGLHVPFGRMRDAIGERYGLVPAGRLEKTGGVAKDFSIAGFRGNISFITPLSESFCARCNRLRVTADGQLKTCLFYAPELSLRDALRRGASDDELAGLVQDALARKPEAHPDVEDMNREADLSMTQIGG